MVFNKKPKKLYNKNIKKTIQKIHNWLLITAVFLITLCIKINNVRAVEKIEGGDLTEKDLQKLKQDKSLQAKLNIFAVRHDPEAKVTGIYSSANDANPFMFDYE